MASIESPTLGGAGSSLSFAYSLTRISCETRAEREEPHRCLKWSLAWGKAGKTLHACKSQMRETDFLIKHAWCHVPRAFHFHSFAFISLGVTLRSRFDYSHDAMRLSNMQNQGADSSSPQIHLSSKNKTQTGTHEPRGQFPSAYTEFCFVLF